MRHSEKMFEILEKASENGGIDLEDGREVYSTRQSFYTAVGSLIERNLMEKKEAPMSSRYKFVWIATEKAKKIVERETESK